MIELKNLTHKYDKELVLDNINFKFYDGKLYTLVGNSGCGKSTLIKLICGLLDSDSVYHDNICISELNKIKLHRSIGYVMQYSGLFPHMKVRENIITPVKLKSNYNKDEINEKIKSLFKLLKLPLSYLDKYPSELSGGEKQRVSIIRAICMADKYLILDEPFSALDPIARKVCQRELIKIHNLMKNLTIIMVTHDISEAMQVSDTILHIHNKCIYQYGSPTKFLLHPKDKVVSKFFGFEKELPEVDINSWRASALEEMLRYGTDSCLVISDDKVVGKLSKDKLIESLKEDESYGITIEKLMEVI